MNGSAIYRRSIVAALSLIVLFVGMVTPTFAKNDNPQVLPPDSHAFGKTYGEWSAAWWQWAYSIPVNNNPLFDETGKNCGVDQSGKVWFLGGTYTTSPDAGGVTRANRLCTIPSGTALFFPILNAECDNFWPPIDPPLQVPELRTLCEGQINSVSNLLADVDGVSLNNLNNYRVISPVFDVTLPDNNIPQFFGFDAPAGKYSPLVGDGYYLMLAPLSVGKHTIHFHGEAGNFVLDITYHITVAPKGKL
ncbi:MAG TPA: hypothetical protein VFT66_26080 [Roseiflexaceae bacterium]|jgi:hypothetical protein|nr:hypothetical protein [Roseiflexaceae bacterium]